ncbi:hypothetical protein QFZ34_003681 [Phyllobacterium ifriqiyense]|uniref:Uncharacterized protein n=1 Tax=Phyllobacterium ifriqiyense TaxID=314238 RepID=A0ABU0SCK9_9HYPH|nr:hypothetical protein [Phyllobacterium ifriqiyense]
MPGRKFDPIMRSSRNIDPFRIAPEQIRTYVTKAGFVRIGHHPNGQPIPSQI